MAQVMTPTFFFLSPEYTASPMSGRHLTVDQQPEDLESFLAVEARVGIGAAEGNRSCRGSP